MRRSMWVCAVIGVLGIAGCNESPTGNGGGNPTESDIIVLNSLSRTIQQFNLIEGQLVPFGQTVNLPANFDGVAIDVIQGLYVTSTSAFGGSQIIFGSLTNGEQAISTFPGTDAALADAGRPTLFLDTGGTVGALVPARARNLIYIAFPGTPSAQAVTGEEAGEFIERVIPFGQFLLAMDANLDDEGGTFQPLGPPRMTVMDFRNGAFFDDLVLTGSLGATDALILQEQVFFLAGGSFNPATFEPMGDGNLVSISVPDRGLQSTQAIGGNGLSIKAGLDGRGYITRTKGAGTFDSDILTYNLLAGQFERGPTNPIQPRDASGTDISCRVANGVLNGRILCATFEASAQGRLYLLESDGTYVDDVAIGAGVTDLLLR